MFNQWIERIKASKPGSDVSDSELADDVARVSASLLVEVARADHQLEPEEISSITSALQQSSTLEKNEIIQIVTAAVVEADDAISLHEHIRLINESFERDQKRLLLEQMWRVAVADGNIDHYEDYTIRKISDLLHMRHSEFIQAKLLVIES